MSDLVGNPEDRFSHNTAHYDYVVYIFSVQDNTQKENLGIVVSYKVKVRLILGFGSGYV